VTGSYPKRLIPILSPANLLDGSRDERSQSADALNLAPASLVGYQSSQSLAEGGRIELHPERTGRGLAGINRLWPQATSPSVADNCTS